MARIAGGRRVRGGVPVIDVESLLKPISDDSPSGPDLRVVPGDETIARAKELRTELSREQDPEGKGREPRWPEALKHCESALRTQSKDLELIAWLCEALTRIEGFSGLERGLDLLLRATGEFWDTIHPGVDEDGITLPIRARPMSWLGSSADFLRGVKQVPITGGDGHSWADYENSQRLDDPSLPPERRSELAELGFISGEQWRSGLAATPGDSLEGLVSALAGCEAKIEALEAFCGERFADEDPPNLYPLRSLLGEVRELLASQGGEAAAEPAAAEAPAAAATPAAAAPKGPLASRSDALRQLREVAEYFRKIEPHSPVSYLIQRAVRWGEMSFEELLVDLTRNDNVLAHIRETLGLDKKQE